MNKTWGALAVVALIFPFAAVGAKIAQTESVVTVIVYAAIMVVLFGSLLIAPRVTLDRTPEAEAVRPARPPAPPVAWSWDGVNRAPEEVDDGAEKAE